MKRVKKSNSCDKKERIEKKEKSDAENKPTLQERKGEEIKSDDIILKEIKEDESKNSKCSNPNNSNLSSPLPPNSNSFNEGEMTKKDQFLSMLKVCRGYPFDEVKDALLFDITATECPNINIIEQTKKKIAWWQEHPDAMKADPREQLQKWFEGEAEFQDRGGPQQIGEIMKELEDPDQRNWAKQFVKKTSR